MIIDSHVIETALWALRKVEGATDADRRWLAENLQERLDDCVEKIKKDIDAQRGGSSPQSGAEGFLSD